MGVFGLGTCMITESNTDRMIACSEEKCCYDFMAPSSVLQAETPPNLRRLTVKPHYGFK